MSGIAGGRVGLESNCHIKRANRRDGFGSVGGSNSAQSLDRDSEGNTCQQNKRNVQEEQRSMGGRDRDCVAVSQLRPDSP